MDELKEIIANAWSFIQRIFTRIINGILNFAQHIVGWFRGLHLARERHVPFIIDAKNPQFKEMIKNARVEDVGIFSKEAQICKGVYDELTDEIIHNEVIGADSLDVTTKNLLRNEPMVVLS